METYIALLRGINVSGQKIIRMKDLAKLLENIGLVNVKTYVQSGNVVFQYKNESTEKLGKLVHDQIYSKFGFDVSVQILTVDSFKNVIKKNPFANDASKDISFLHVTFLASIPEKYDFNPIEDKKAVNEEIEITNKAAYLFCPNGYGKTKLNNTFLEKQLGVDATTRNWKTVLKLQEISQNMAK